MTNKYRGDWITYIKLPGTMWFEKRDRIRLHLEIPSYSGADCGNIEQLDVDLPLALLTEVLSKTTFSAERKKTIYHVSKIEVITGGRK